MATVQTTLRGILPVTRPGYVPDNRRFDWIVTLMIVWFMSGIFLDGWAHNTFGDSLETFFTPWHGVLYSGFTATATVIAGFYARNRLLGYGWTRALPRGYVPALAGAGLFAMGGGFDLAWHTLFGIEANVEALLSPAHLLLATGATLILGSPFWAAWQRADGARRPGWAALAPALLSWLAVFSLFTFFTQYANAFQHPNTFVERAPRTDFYTYEVTTIAYFLIPAVLTMGFILLALRRWSLPFGSLTLLIAGNAALMFVQGSDYAGRFWIVLCAALAGGLLADGLYAALRPSPTRLVALRAFAFLVPFTLYLLYLLALLATTPIWWGIAMWLGAPFLAGVIGLGLSFLLAPPPAPASDQPA